MCWFGLFFVCVFVCSPYNAFHMSMAHLQPVSGESATKHQPTKHAIISAQAHTYIDSPWIFYTRQTISFIIFSIHCDPVLSPPQTFMRHFTTAFRSTCIMTQVTEYQSSCLWHHLTCSIYNIRLMSHFEDNLVSWHHNIKPSWIYLLQFWGQPGKLAPQCQTILDLVAAVLRTTW